MTRSSLGYFDSQREHKRRGTDEARDPESTLEQPAHHSTAASLMDPAQPHLQRHGAVLSHHDRSGSTNVHLPRPSSEPQKAASAPRAGRGYWSRGSANPR